MTPTLHNGDVFANTTKNSGDSRMYSYWDLAWIKRKFKKWFFGQNFQNFWQNWILIFCCTTSVGMLFLELFANFLHERFLEIWLGQESVTDKRTDGRTDIHGGKNNICLPQGETYNKTNLQRTESIYIKNRRNHHIFGRQCFDTHGRTYTISIHRESQINAKQILSEMERVLQSFEDFVSMRVFKSI